MNLTKSLSLITLCCVGTFLTSCACMDKPNRNPDLLPSFSGSMPPITTHAIEIQGDKGEKVRFNFNRKTGTCETVTITNSQYEHQSFSCDSDEISTEIERTYFCVPVYLSGGKKPNAQIAGAQTELYCGSVKLMTEGTDIQFKDDMEKDNRKVRKQGGRAIAY